MNSTPKCRFSEERAYTACINPECQIPAFICKHCDNQKCMMQHEHDGSFKLEMVTKINQNIEKNREIIRVEDDKKLEIISKTIRTLIADLQKLNEEFKQKLGGHVKSLVVSTEYQAVYNRYYSQEVNQITGSELKRLVDAYKNDKLFTNKSKLKGEVRKELEQMQNLAAHMKHSLLQYINGQQLSAVTQENQTTDVVALLNLAINYQNINKYKEALENYAKVIKIAPNTKDVFANRGMLYQLLGRNAEAQQDYNKALQHDPNNIDVYNYRSMIYRNSSRFEEAINDYTNSIRLDPNVATTYYNRATLYHNAGKLQQALKDYTNAITLNSSDADYFYKRGLCNQKLLRSEDAEVDFTFSISLKPSAQAFTSRGILFYNTNKYELAEKNYTLSLELQPNNARVIYLRGVVYLSENKMAEAEADFTKAISINNKDCDYYLKRAIAYQHQNKLELAHKDYETAIELNPKDPEIHFRMGILEHTMKDNVSAQLSISKAISINPNKATYYQSRSSIRRHLNRTAESEEDSKLATTLSKI